MNDRLTVLDQRPQPGEPRRYDFPDFERTRLDNGLTLVRAHVPGRPLLQAQLLVRGDAGGGATSEAPPQAGVTVLAARAMSEGTAVRDAVAFIEASERLGAEMGASAGWDSLSLHVEVPRTHLAQAMGLFAEMALQPSFPAREVERLRDERLNDLRQVMADPRRRAEKAFPKVIYAAAAAYARPTGGVEETVASLDRDLVAARHEALLRPAACTLLVCGDLAGLPLDAIVADSFGAWAGDAPSPSVGVAPDLPAKERRVVLVDRPGAPQSEDPHRTRRHTASHRGFPRAVGDQRPAGRAVQLAPQPAAARGARLHLWGQLGLRDAACGGPLRGALRGGIGRHGPRHRRHHGGAGAGT